MEKVDKNRQVSFVKTTAPHKTVTRITRLHYGSYNEADVLLVSVWVYIIEKLWQATCIRVIDTDLLLSLSLLSRPVTARH